MMEGDDKALIDALMTDYCETLSLGWGPFDIKDVERLYLREDIFQAYDIQPPNEGYIGWDSYAAAWNVIMDKYVYFEMQYIGEIHGGRRGDVIWSDAPFLVYIRATRDGEQVRKDGRVTLVWVRQGDEWLVVHEHVSIPRETPSTVATPA